MPQKSINELSELTGKDRRTIKTRLDNLKFTVGPKRSHLYDSAQALALIYGVQGSDEEGGLTLEQARIRLLVKQATQCDVDTETKRRTRIPIEVAGAANDEAFQAASAILKSQKGKALTEDTINEIFGILRAIPDKLKW